MRRLLITVMMTVPLLLASAVGLAQDATVVVREDPVLGPFLTDAAGMTLYRFANDTTPGESTCSDQCAENWPAFTADEPLTLPDGVDGELTTFTRTDGATQVAYNGIPLYYFGGDEQPGDTNGQGRGDVWYVVAPGAEFGVLATPEAAPDTSAAGTPAAAGEVVVTVEEFAVVISTTTFAVGQEYTFSVTNAGEFPHEFVIEPVGAIREAIEADGQAAAIDVVEPGATATLTWTFAEPGLYQFACHFFTHYPQGMAVTVEVV